MFFKVFPTQSIPWTAATLVSSLGACPTLLGSDKIQDKQEGFSQVIIFFYCFQNWDLHELSVTIWHIWDAAILCAGAWGKKGGFGSWRPRGKEETIQKASHEFSSRIGWTKIVTKNKFKWLLLARTDLTTTFIFSSSPPNHHSKCSPGLLFLSEGKSKELCKPGHSSEHIFGVRSRMEMTEDV